MCRSVADQGPRVGICRPKYFHILPPYGPPFQTHPYPSKKKESQTSRILYKNSQKREKWSKIYPLKICRILRRLLVRLEKYGAGTDVTLIFTLATILKNGYIIPLSETVVPEVTSVHQSYHFLFK